MDAVSVTLAEPHERTALENMFQLYVHDFSELWAGQARGELDDNGRFEPYPLELWWRDAGRIPLLIRKDGALVGFALLNEHSHSGQPLDRAIAEFFVVRKHRRSGVALAAAQTIFSRYPGQWEAAVARTNTAALAFWRKAASTHPDGSDLEESDVRTDDWNGPVLRFRIGAPNSGKSP